MAGYMETAARPHVLAELVLAAGAVAGHEPNGYDVFIAAAEAERWASVVCSCGGNGRAEWRSGDTDYSMVLQRAWAARECA